MSKRKPEDASGVEKVDIWTEMVYANAVVAGLALLQTKIDEKITSLVRTLCLGAAWQEWRVAYGVQVVREDGTSLTKLQWTDRLEIGKYDPSVQELFQNIQLCEGQRYCLVLSKLHLGLTDPSIRDRADRSFGFYSCLQRYASLYDWPRKPIPPDAAPAAPERGAPAKRPATAPAGGGAGGSRASKLLMNLAALKDLQF